MMAWLSTESSRSDLSCRYSSDAKQHSRLSLEGIRMTITRFVFQPEINGMTSFGPDQVFSAVFSTMGFYLPDVGIIRGMRISG